MKARAPGKLLLSGAYAVLDGAPALVAAVDRYATADGARSDSDAMPEVRAAVANPPFVDVSQLRTGDTKLGLGSSAAATVAALGVRAAEQGDELDDPLVRQRLMQQAWDAHARVQGGGSGVDVAASTFGGALRYIKGQTPTATRLPTRLVWRVFFSGKSARTSDLRAKVDALRTRDPKRFSATMQQLADNSQAALSACDDNNAEAFIDASKGTSRALAELGAAAEAPVVLPEAAALATLAEAEGGAFLPSGAGGGDCALFFGTSEPSVSFVDSATRLSQSVFLEIKLDLRGVHVSP